MKNRNFLFLVLLMNPALCLGSDDNCVTDARNLLDLSTENFADIAEDYIRQGKITYTSRIQTRMSEQGVSESDIEYVLHYPVEIRPRRRDGPNKYNITGLADKKGSQLRLGVSFGSQGELVIFAIMRTRQKELKIPLERENFIPFINGYLDREKFIYSANAGRRMEEHMITEDDVEYALKNPIEVGNKTAMQNHAFDPIYVRGQARDGKLLNIGVASSMGKFITVTTANRILNDQLPLLKKEFVKFISEGRKRIVYTQHAYERMGELDITESDVEHILQNPLKIIYRSNDKGYYILGKTQKKKRLRLMLSFDGRIIVFAMDVHTPFSMRGLL